jgi:hypothetical protein
MNINEVTNRITNRCFGTIFSVILFDKVSVYSISNDYKIFSLREGYAILKTLSG